MTNSENAQRLAEIKARLDAATPGEWTVLESEWDCRCNEEDAKRCEKNGPDTCGKGVCIQGALVPEIKTVKWCGYCDMSDADAKFIANARPDIEWQRERIRALEAELANHMDKLQCWLNTARNFLAEWRKARKWARRWKMAAKYVGGRSCLDAITYTRECLEHRVMVCEMQARRITALENAVRSCRTCKYGTLPLDQEPPNRCFECSESQVKYGGWVFDEARFAPEGDVSND